MANDTLKNWTIGDEEALERVADMLGCMKEVSHRLTSVRRYAEVLATHTEDEAIRLDLLLLLRVYLPSVEGDLDLLNGLYDYCKRKTDND